MSKFEDSFADPSVVESLMGDLVLKEYGPVKIGVNHADITLVEYARKIAEYTRNRERALRLFGE